MRKIILKSIILFLGIVFFYACSPKISQNIADIPNESVEESEFIHFIEIMKFHQKLNMDSLLNSYNKSISISEELIIPLDTVVESDSSRVVVIGKFINEKDVFAFDIYGTWDKQNIDFYKLENGKWNRIISDECDCDVLHFSFENFNDDEDAEVTFLGHPNMNGNRVQTIYKYDSEENKFIKSGSFFCSELNYDNKSSFLFYDLEGSWYTQLERSIFKWSQNKIIPLRKVVKELKKYNYKSQSTWIRYYENPTQDKDTLVLKFKKTYKEKDKKLYDLWDNFFENK